MTDAEQQVRETLGWELLRYEPPLLNRKRMNEWGANDPGVVATGLEEVAYNALVSKTAELMEMNALFTKHMHGLLDALQMSCDPDSGSTIATLDETDIEELRLQVVGRVEELKSHAESAEKQRDEAQKALEQADKNWQGVFGTQDGQAVIVAKTLENDALLKRAESAEATIREQSERIKELEEALKVARHYMQHRCDFDTSDSPDADFCTCQFSVSRQQIAKALRGKQ